nr:hypothetical protein [Ornithinimicrobium cerasi]
MTDTVPPTLSTSTLGMVATDNPAGCTASSTWCHVAPACTTAVRASTSTVIASRPRMSTTSPPGCDACPPSACCVPPTDTARSCSAA